MIDPYSTSVEEQVLKNAKYSSLAGMIITIAECHGVGLNTKANIDGFNARKKVGFDAGNTLLISMKTNPRVYFDKDGKSPNTIDIVCHSMGYAYAIGMINALKDKVPFGRFYIIAPENAGSGGADWTIFSEVWQYGSDEEALKNTPKLQDGVAPQVSVPDVDNKGKNPKGGRAYIPTDGSAPQGFLQSHSIGNFKWIFKLTPPVNKTQNINGYVIPR